MTYTPSYDLVIATPAYGGLVTTSYTSSLIKSFYGLHADRVSHKVLFLDNESLIQRGRDKCAGMAIETGARRLMFIDADIGWDYKDLKALMDAMTENNLSVIAGTYPCKTFPIQLNYNPLPADIDTYFKGDRKRTSELHKEFAKAKGDIVEMMHVPTGFMLIDIEKVLVNGIKVDSYSSMGKPLHAFFPVRVKNGVLESEDWGFCSICREQGIPVYLHTGIVLPHQGSMAFDWTKFG